MRFFLDSWAIALLISNFLVLMPAAGNAQENPHTSLRVLSFNVRTWTRDMDSSSKVYWRTRMAAMERMVKDVDPDVICFQEMLFPATRYVPDGYKRVSGINISHPIFVRKGLIYNGHSNSIYWEACTINGIRIINVHSRWEKGVMDRVVRQVNDQLTGCDLACGDWNVTLKSLRNAGLNMTSARVELGVPEEDTFANFKRPESSHGAIDHFFISGITPLSYRMITDGYGCKKISDHYPIVLEIRK